MADVTEGIAADQLRSLIERIERLESDKAEIATDIKEVYLEAKSNGFDAKTIRDVIKLRKMDAAKRQEREAMLDLYLNALGELADTPLGKAAAVREFKIVPTPMSALPSHQADLEEAIAEHA